MSLSLNWSHISTLGTPFSSPSLLFKIGIQTKIWEQSSNCHSFEGNLFFLELLLIVINSLKTEGWLQSIPIATQVLLKTMKKWLSVWWVWAAVFSSVQLLEGKTKIWYLSRFPSVSVGQEHFDTTEPSPTFPEHRLAALSSVDADSRIHLPHPKHGRGIPSFYTCCSPAPVVLLNALALIHLLHCLYPFCQKKERKKSCWLPLFWVSSFPFPSGWPSRAYACRLFQV